MKTFLAEYIVDYKTYTFSYAPYALREGEENFTPIYDKGYLPYTADLSIEKEIFYLARSLRVNLEKFEDTSENRRVARQIEPLNIEMECLAKSDMDLQRDEFKAFCHQYISERIGDENMSIERFEYILSRPLGTHIFRFYNESQTLGYVLTALNDATLHYWFSFFDTTYMKSHSLGKYIMWALIRWAKDHGRSYVYLGTAYKQSALYKIRDHKGLEFFDGTYWSNDTKRLKDWCKNDENTLEADRFKLLNEKSEFINNL